MAGSIESESKKDTVWDKPEVVVQPPVAAVSARPPIEYTSLPAFVKSVKRRFVSLWTKRFILSLLAGQVVSFAITCTSVATTELVMRNWALPTTQSFFL